MTRFLEKAQDKVDKLTAGSNFYSDDWMWNDDETVIQFQLIEFLGMRKDGLPNERHMDPFRFCYKAGDDEWYGTIEEQFDTWLRERIVNRFFG